MSKIHLLIYIIIKMESEYISFLSCLMITNQTSVYITYYSWNKIFFYNIELWLFMFGNMNDDDYYNLSLKSFDSKEYEKALEYINKAINIKSLNLNYRIQKVHILLEMSDYKNALEELKFMENMDGYNPDIYTYESMCYSSIGDYDNSLKFASKSLELDSENEMAYFNKSVSLKNLGHYKESIKIFEKYLKWAIKIQLHIRSLPSFIFMLTGIKCNKWGKNSPKIWYGKQGCIWYSALYIQYDNEITKYFETVINAFENTANFYYLNQLNDFIVEHDMYDIGEDLYKTYIKLYPDISLFYDLFAYLLMSENKKEEAYNIYKKY